MIWDQHVTSIPGVGPKRGQLLVEMGIRTVGRFGPDLYRFAISTRPSITLIAHLQPNEFVTIHAEVLTSRLIRTRSRQEIVVATVADASRQDEPDFLPSTLRHQEIDRWRVGRSNG